MPIVNSIPEKYQNGFEELAKLSDEDFSKIENALQQIPLVSSIDSLILKIYKSVEIEVDLEDILSSVASIIAFIESRDVITEIANDIANLCVTYELIDEDLKEKCAKRLIYLFNQDQFFYASKAEDLLKDYSNAYIIGRIVSDIRPVFDIDLTRELKVGMILHNLSIHYQSNDEPFHKNITLTLTPGNIRELKDVLSRAETKEKSLLSVFKKSEIFDLNEQSYGSY